MNRRSFVFAAVIAGLAMGALGNLPVVNLVNCLLCLWTWLGGALAVILYRRFEHSAQPLSAGQGAGLGAVAGLVGAVFGALVFLVTASVSMTLFKDLSLAFHVEGDLPVEPGSTGWYLAQTGVFLVIDVVLYPLFGALGGLITANMTRAKAA